jgi:hypothetical protein
MFQHDNTRPYIRRICKQFLEAEHLPWPAYSPDMSPMEHVWDALYRHVQRVPVPANTHPLCPAIEEEKDNIPQSTINSMMNFIWRRCVALLEANGGHTRYWLIFWSTSLPFLKVSETNRCITVFPVMWNP